jgi:RNA polymerase sigma-70 factor (ECF subfamily)
MVMVDTETARAFTDFAEGAEPRLRRALCVASGRQTGLEATAAALEYAWEHWDRLRGMDNPVGYLYRVGRTAARREWRRRDRTAPLFDPVAVDRLPWVEPGLPGAVARLSEQQRIAVVLHHCFGWTHAEVADLLGIGPTTVQKHIERGMKKIRAALGVAR